jgi:hypothetical protein
VSDRERVSDERLRAILNFAGDAADNVPGALGAYADAMSIEVTLSVFAELLDARDRIARAVDELRGADAARYWGARDGIAHAIAILTGDEQ